MTEMRTHKREGRSIQVEGTSLAIWISIPKISGCSRRGTRRRMAERSGMKEIEEMEYRE